MIWSKRTAPRRGRVADADYCEWIRGFGCVVCWGRLAQLSKQQGAPVHGVLSGQGKGGFLNEPAMGREIEEVAERGQLTPDEMTAVMLDLRPRQPDA